MTAALTIAMHPEAHGWEWFLILAAAHYAGHVLLGHRVAK